MLGSSALRAVEEALLSERPKPRYQLRERVGLLRAVSDAVHDAVHPAKA